MRQTTLKATRWLHPPALVSIVQVGNEKKVLKFYKEKKQGSNIQDCGGELFFLLDTKPSPDDLPTPFKNPVEVSTSAG